jgi:hypothetical protein
VRSEAAAGGRDIAVRDEGLVEHLDSGFLRTSSRVPTPLPTMTPSALRAKPSGACEWTTTPFIDALVARTFGIPRISPRR